MRRLILPLILALLLMAFLSAWLPGGNRAALAASPAAGLQATVTTYTTYLPLLLREILPSLYPNDPLLNLEWGLEAVAAPQAWGVTCGCPSALVAVVDSGVDLSHPDLAGKVRTDIDWDFVSDDDSADDGFGHGTHVAGIAAAATNNGTGVAGLGWEATVLPLRVLNDSGLGYADDVAEAIRYATDHGAQVINLSLGGLGACPSYLQDAVNYAYARGVVVVAAAGNHGGSVPDGSFFPANCTHVLGVAATEPGNTIAAYSNTGDHVSVAAPGTGIYSTLIGGYGEKSGTSMAAPHVAGLAALVRAVYPAYTPDQVASAILDNASDLGAPGWDPLSGCGQINAYAALTRGAPSSAPLCRSRTYTGTARTLPATRFAAGEVIFTLRPGASAMGLAQRYGARAEFMPDLGAWRLRVPAGAEQRTLSLLRADPAVLQADLNVQVAAQ
jgi:subtilisin family serine protease